MNKRLNLAVTVIALVILGLINFNILSFERILNHGQRVILELTPVDPRSLMQGDYMTLGFVLTREIEQALDAASATGVNLATLELDEQQRAHLVALGSDKSEPLAAQQVRVQYRQHLGRVRLGTDAFFFQEGKAELFEQARYGLFKVNDQGKMLMTSLLDADLNPIESRF